MKLMRYGRKGHEKPALLDDKGRHVVSVAVPIERVKQVHGVLLLSIQGGEIEQLIWRERRSILIEKAWVPSYALGPLLAVHGATMAKYRPKAAIRVR